MEEKRQKGILPSKMSILKSAKLFHFAQLSVWNIYLFVVSYEASRIFFGIMKWVNDDNCSAHYIVIVYWEEGIHLKKKRHRSGWFNINIIIHRAKLNFKSSSKNQKRRIISFSLLLSIHSLNISFTLSELSAARGSPGYLFILLNWCGKKGERKRRVERKRNE